MPSAAKTAAKDQLAVPEAERAPQPILRQIAAKRAERMAAKRRSRIRAILQVLVALVVLAAGIFGGENGRILLGLGLIALSVMGALTLWNLRRGT